MKIGFIGLGIMGKPMVRNLIKAGNEVIGYDVVEENIEIMMKDGMIPGKSSRDVAEQCRILITMLPNSPHVKEVVLGKNGVLEGAEKGSILIDMSSIAPTASKEIEKICKEKGIDMIDAPVSGGEPKAVDGTLSVMVGGDKKIFEQVKPILKEMAASVVYCGDIGAGNTTKLANQIIVAVNIAAVSEAFMLAKKAGVDQHLVFEAIKGGLAGSTVMNAKVPMILEHNYKPGFKVDLHIKDLNNAIETAHATGSPVPLTAAVMEMLQVLHADGCGQEDHSALYKVYEKLV